MEIRGGDKAEEGAKEDEERKRYAKNSNHDNKQKVS